MIRLLRRSDGIVATSGEVTDRKEVHMTSPATMTISIFFMAVGAIFTFAVTTEAEGISLDAAGWILMILGAAGLLASLVLSARQGPGAFHEERSRDRDRS